MSDRDAFIRQICEHPADDVARWVFADWLDEHGEPHLAEFIRVQCELSLFDTSYYLSYDNCRMCENSAVPLIKRSAELLHKAWSQTLIDFCHETQLSSTSCNWWEFRRGFPAWLDLTKGELRTHAAAIFRIFPATEIHVGGADPLNCADMGEPPTYIWVRSSRDDRWFTSWEIPDELWGDELNLNFTTEDAAVAALSKRCVHYGRKLAGLPPLPTPTPVA